MKRVTIPQNALLTQRPINRGIKVSDKQEPTVPALISAAPSPLNVSMMAYAAGMATYILFLDGALLAVVGVGHAGPPADDAAALVGAVVALVTDAHQGAGPHVGVTDHTLAIT